MSVMEKFVKNNSKVKSKNSKLGALAFTFNFCSLKKVMKGQVLLSIFYFEEESSERTPIRYAIGMLYLLLSKDVEHKWVTQPAMPHALLPGT